jgi:hypothetical protein
MTNFFKSIFGKRSNATNSTAASSSATLPVMPMVTEPQEYIPPHDLFVDSTPPARTTSEVVKSEKPVKVFLDRNHEHQGRMAGYESHAHDMLPIYKAELQASFRASLERMIELAEIDLLEIRTQVIEVGDAIPSVRQKLELRVQMLQSNIEEMRMQKILSVDDEGLIAPAVQSFTKGYRLGMQDYFQERNFGDFSVL